MKKLLAPMLCAVLIATGGCIFSSDEGGAPPPAPGSWQPELYITPDSVSVFFPNDWPDTTTFTWNVYREGVREYLMDAVVRLSTFRPLDAHFSFVREAEGVPRQHGTFAEMARGGKGEFWVTDPRTGDKTSRGYGQLEFHVLNDGVLVRMTGWDAELVDGFPPKVDQAWPVTFTRLNTHEMKTVVGRVHYRHDLAQALARNVDGPLFPDDYVILDLVVKNFAAGGWPRPLVVSQSIVVRWPFDPRDYAYLGLDNDTRAAFEVANKKTWDLSAMSQLGYEVVADNTPLNYGDLQIAVSGIGYNHARTEAVVYATTYCGMLCAEGDLIVLEKINGYWRLKLQWMLWIS